MSFNTFKANNPHIKNLLGIFRNVSLVTAEDHSTHLNSTQGSGLKACQPALSVIHRISL